MGHIIKKRTKFQKGNFVLNRNEFYVFGRMHGYYLPSKLYFQFQLPYYYPCKVTVLQKKYYDYMHKKNILNWLSSKAQELNLAL